MSRTTAVLAVLAVFPLAGLTACGSNDSDGSSGADKGAATSAETTASASAASTAAPAAPAAPAPTPAKNAEVVAACHQTFDPFIATLNKIDERLAAKPDYQSYREMTRKLTAGYTSLRTDQIPSSTCQHDVNVTISGARLTHIITIQNWAECRKRKNCSKTMATFKQSWNSAGEMTDTAAKGFDDVTAS